LIPAAKAFAVLVRVVCRDQAVKTPSGQALQYFLHPAYPVHVVALVVELALRGLPRSTRGRNTLLRFFRKYSGQQCAFAGMTIFSAYS
jgi:hypothetical protein